MPKATQAWEEIQKKFEVIETPEEVVKPLRGNTVNHLHITYYQLPPSTNRIYVRGTILSTEAREYQANFIKEVTQNYGHIINQMDDRAIYALHLRFFFPTVINETYRNEKVAPSKRAKNRYKKFDLTNRIKFLEDCVKMSLAIDDCQTFAASQEKHQDPTNPRVEIDVHTVDPSLFGVSEELPLI